MRVRRSVTSAGSKHSAAAATTSSKTRSARARVEERRREEAFKEEVGRRALEERMAQAASRKVKLFNGHMPFSTAERPALAEPATYGAPPARFRPKTLVADYEELLPPSVLMHQALE